MKKPHYLLIVLISFNSICFAQTVLPKNNSGMVEYTEVVKVDSATKSQIYSAARQWFVESFNDAKEVLQVQDSENGELIGKGLFNIPSNRFGYTAIGIGIVNFQIKVSAKDGRYKYVITNFIHEGGLPQILDCGSLDDDTPDQCNKKIFAEVKEKTDIKVKALIISLKRAIGSSSRANDDW